MMGPMEKKWALITGASSGIGAATAEKLAAAGYNLVLTARRLQRLETLKKNLQERAKVEIILAGFDMRQPKEIQNFLRDQASTLKNLDVLVNNAGLAKGIEKFQEANLEDWDMMLETNVRGLLYMTRGIVPWMIERGGGHIVNMGSVAGRWVYPGGSVYCASKFAVRAISEGLRQDLVGKNIRVSNIEPGMVDTEFSLVRMGSQQKADAVYAGMKPLTAEDIAETISWVLSRPAHINVQELVVYPTAQAHIGLVHRN